jgi:hypothetical protein
MAIQPVRRSRLKMALAAMFAVAALGALLFGVSNAEAAQIRGRAKGKIACIQLREGGNKLESSLDELVQDGTITAVQKDAILDRVTAGMEPGARLCTGMTLARDRVVGKAVQDLLGMTQKEIRVEWLDGKSLTEIAEAKGVDRATLISTITTAVDTKLSDAVEQGNITADRKAEIDAQLPDLIGNAVDTHLSDVVDQLRDADKETTPVSSTSAGAEV